MRNIKAAFAQTQRKELAASLNIGISPSELKSCFPLSAGEMYRIKEMQDNLVCSLCRSQPIAHFCICSNLPSLCRNCKAVHETKQDFHFALPMAARGYINAENQQLYYLWFRSLAKSQEKLRENLLLIDQCRRHINALDAEFCRIIKKMTESLETLKAALSQEIEEAIEQTSINAYFGDYEPKGPLAPLIWSHSCQESQDPIPVFTYQVQTYDLESCIGLSFRTSIPEIAHLNYGKEEGEDQGKELAMLKAELADQKAANERLIAHEKESAYALHCLASREVQLTQEVETWKAQVDAANGKEWELTTHCQCLQSELEKLKEASQQLHFKLESQESRERELEEQVRGMKSPVKPRKSLFQGFLSKLRSRPAPEQSSEASDWCEKCGKTVPRLSVRGVVCCALCSQQIIQKRRPEPGS